MMEKFLEILVKRINQKFYKPIDIHSIEYVIEEIKVRMIFLVVNLFCEQVVNKLKRKKIFLFE